MVQGHPGWRRCSSVTYAQYSPSSRLASRAPRSGTYATHHASRGLAATRRKDALQRDAEVERQVRLQVVVRLVAAGRREGLRPPSRRWTRQPASCTGCRRRTAGPARRPPGRSGWSSTPARCSACAWDGISLSSSVTVSLPPVSPRSCSDSPGPCPGCIGARPCRSGRAKFDLAVAAVGRPEQREERGVLRQRQQLPVAPRPALRREVEREDADLCDKRIGHFSPVMLVIARPPIGL